MLRPGGVITPHSFICIKSNCLPIMLSVLYCCSLKRKSRQDDSLDSHWRRWRQASTSPVNIKAIILTTFPFPCCSFCLCYICKCTLVKCRWSLKTSRWKLWTWKLWTLDYPCPLSNVGLAIIWLSKMGHYIVDCTVQKEYLSFLIWFLDHSPDQMVGIQPK